MGSSQSFRQLVIVKSTLSLIGEFHPMESLIDELEKSLAPLQELIKSREDDSLDHYSRAKVNMAIAYVVHSVFFMYLKTEGIEPSTHPFGEETQRLREYMKKLRER